MDLKSKLVQQRFSKQNELKYKNNGNKFKGGKAEIFDHQYIEKLGEGSFCKGCTEIVIEHMMYKYMIENGKSIDGFSLKQEIIGNFVTEFKNNISLVDFDLAENHLSILNPLLGNYISNGKWEPDKFLKNKEGINEK